MTKVAAVIMAETRPEAERQAHAALADGADLVELRLDHIRPLGPKGIARIPSAIRARGIATLRSPSQGGATGELEGTRESLLGEIASRHFAYLDIELQADGERAEEIAAVAARQGTTLIVSHHLSEPVELARVADSVEACAALGDVAKVAVPVDEIDLAVQLVDLAQSLAARKRRVVVIGMGTAGTITRALADHVGQEIQYAAWADRAAALGQLPFAAAKRMRGHEPTVLGLVGHPLGHSLSPAIHEAALNAIGMPAVYLPFDVGPDSLRVLLDDADRLRIRGFNVTHPYKESIVQKLDELDGDAGRIGVVNTVVIRDGWTTGYNTDTFGFRRSLRAFGMRVSGRRSLVVGAGGAAKAVVDVLVREGAQVQVTNRSPDGAQALADAFGGTVDALPLDSLSRGGPWDLLVNATPVGTAGLEPGLPVPESVLEKVGSVYDLVYNPPRTTLIAAAKRLGRPAFSGLEMLLNQAAKSFELWTGRSPPVDAMRQAAKEALG
jgi:shikimate dehydrogenase/3-dehydroquinate dehydratase type I